jgi:mRNA interferase RelE/StbE
MSYSLLILRRAQKELSSLPEEVYRRIKQAILDLSEDSKPRGCKKLRGREGLGIEKIFINR